jgi:hypothetical protein
MLSADAPNSNCDTCGACRQAHQLSTRAMLTQPPLFAYAASREQPNWCCKITLVSCWLPGRHPGSDASKLARHSSCLSSRHNCCCECRSSPFTFSLFSSTRVLTLLPSGKLTGEHAALFLQVVSCGDVCMSGDSCWCDNKQLTLPWCPALPPACSCLKRHVRRRHDPLERQHRQHGCRTLQAAPAG